MIKSFYTIDFIATTGGATTSLLTGGSWVDRQIDFPAAGQVKNFTPIGATWGKARGMGGVRRLLEWGRYIEHDSHVMAAGYCISHPASMPFMTPGKLHIHIYGGSASWDLEDAVILAAVTRLSSEGYFATLTSYRVEAGKTTVVTS
jgi:hypothetical protein